MKRLTALCAVLALSLPLTACTDDDPGLDEGSNDSGAEGDRVVLSGSSARGS